MSLVRSRNQRADEEHESGGAERSLMCRAHGCPLRWTVQTGEITACSYHAWEDPKHWPRITDELKRYGTWKLESKPGTSPTVRDMKTRLRQGGKLAAPEPEWR